MDARKFTLMTNRLHRMVLVLASVGLLLISATHAAPGAFCEEYANVAVQQYHAALASKMPGIRPPAWSDDFDGHRAWCLLPFTSKQAANQETTNRQIALDKHRFAKGNDPKQGTMMEKVKPVVLPKQPPAQPNYGGLLGKPSTFQGGAKKPYTLICQGKINPAFSVNYTNAQGPELTYRFNHSKRSATQGLGMGECAWLDRAFDPGEPNSLLIPLRQLDGSVPRWEISSRYGGYKMKAISTNGMFLDVHTVAPNGTRKKHPVSGLFDGSAKPVILKAFNNGKQMVVTGVGP